MITRAEVLALRAEWQVDAAVIEKDHALGGGIPGTPTDRRAGVRAVGSARCRRC